MSRERFVWRKFPGEEHSRCVELDLNAPIPPRVGPYIMSDIREYPSVITGEIISSRSTHRDHLRAHGCVELGNDMPQMQRTELPPVRDDLERALQASPETHAEARAVSERAAAVELPGDAP